MSDDDPSFLNIIKATRFKRSLPIVMVALIFPAYTNTFSLEIAVLLITIVSIYGIASIHNAYRDNDFKMPPYFKVLATLSLFAAIALSSINKIIFTTTIFAIFLGFLYNTISRYVILGDGAIAGLTHYVLPLAASAILVNAPLQTTMSIPLFYFLMISMIPITNLKDIAKDKALGYKTLVNSVKNPFWTATAFFNASFILIFLIYLLFEIPLVYLIPLFILQCLITHTIHKNSIVALNLSRIYYLLSFIIIILFTTNITIIQIISGAIFTIYLTIFISILKNE